MLRSVRLGVLAAVTVAACGTSSSKPADDRRSSEDGTPSPAETAEFAARRAEYIATTPRVPRRIEGYGIELDIPADITLPRDPGLGQRFLMQSYGCAVELVVDPPFAAPFDVLLEEHAPIAKVRAAEYASTDDGWRLRQDLELSDEDGRGLSFSKTTVFRRVGATPIVCSGEAACVDWLCADLRAVPGGSAETPHRTSTPSISIEERHGQGFFLGGIEVWRDGLVHYFGPSCPTWRGREANVDPARVQNAIAAVIGLGAVDPHRPATCFDCPKTHVHVRSGLARRRFTFGHGDSAAMTQALDILRNAVGRNPCT